MQTLIDTFREQMQKQQLPMMEFQRQWVEAMEAMMETEMEAARQYWDTWFAMSHACLKGGEKGSNPMDMGKECADMFCELNKTLLEHAHKRQQLTQDWRERINEIM
ncbi:hypothetical protein [Marinospirillum sp.]|uniref:hypothetical protein n=1 Tax=Marinospirillum sp. TaxID=2183934 RepID=UPI0028706AB3|nr:hypothetical protein [Marinospirillum sp.]MDR9467107.1 hypothetical protein [Marinospirillum sp.]